MSAELMEANGTNGAIQRVTHERTRAGALSGAMDSLATELLCRAKGKDKLSVVC